MLLNVAEAPVRLEMLDQSGRRISEAEAHLVQIDENHALIRLAESASSARLHWGKPVRFELEDANNRYEVTGTIIARRSVPHPAESREAEFGEAVILTWELRIRIWDCILSVERRQRPRRKIGFPVYLYEAATSPAQEENSNEPAEPIVARCMDIGAGGIRVRIPKVSTMPARMRLEFCVPVNGGNPEASHLHRFCLSGRVIRALPQGRYADNLDVAFCFEELSVRDGLALHNLLA